MVFGRLIQNTPFQGQAIHPITKGVIPINDFVGTFEALFEDESIGMVNVTRNSDNTRCFSFPTHYDDIVTINIKEHSEKVCGIGAGCWLSSIAMSAWLLKNHSVHQNNRVLEFGCGIGLPSLVLSSVKSSSASLVVASDYLVTLGCAYDENISINKQVLQVPTHYECIDWNLCIANDFKPDEQYDVIIATDCIYKSTAQLFKNTVLKFLRPGGKLIFINPLETSRPGVDSFIYSLAEMGEIDVKHIQVVMDGMYASHMMFVEFTLM